MSLAIVSRRRHSTNVHVGQAFEPELWQSVAAGSLERCEVEEYVTALLRHVAEEIERVERNRRQESYEAPTGWGPAEYATDVFIMRGYVYPDDESGQDAPVNFEATVPGVGTVRLRWYKHLGRSMSVDRRLTPDQWIAVFNACLDSLRRINEAAS
jgi:hypothetical protein